VFGDPPVRRQGYEPQRRRTPSGVSRVTRKQILNTLTIHYGDRINATN
jgi:hypothetical protein